jgi:hypothetical protein
MSTRASNSTQPKSIPVDDTIRGITSGIAQIDAFRATAYGNLLTVRGVKDQQLSREQKLLEIEYGPNDPQVAAIQSKLAVNQAIRTDLTVAQIQAATPRPTVDKSSYVFHGFIRGRQRQPRPRLTVALYDGNGSWAREFGYSCTDENGYFLLRFTQSASGGKAAATQLGEVTPAAGGSEGSSQTSAQLDAGSLEVRVYDSQQKLLYRSPTPLTPKLRQTDYRLIILDDSADDCSPPPPSADSTPPVTGDSAKALAQNVASITPVATAPTLSKSTEPTTSTIAVPRTVVPAASPTQVPPVAASSTTAAALASQQVSTRATALMSRFITENYPRIEHELSAGPVTKSAFLQLYANSTAENGETVKNLLAILPDDSVFPSVDAIPDALAQREAKTLQASSGGTAALTQAFGGTPPAGPIAPVTVDKFLAIPTNVRKILRSVGIKTVGDLASATSAVLSRVATKLKQNNVATSLGDLAELAGQAKVLVHLQ